MALTVTQVNPSSNSTPSADDLERIERKLSPAAQKLMRAAALSVAAQRGLLPDGARLAALAAPQTDEELLEAVEDLTGYRIPRAAVCLEHGHTSPAQTFCDIFFERARNVLWIGNRGGGKTTNSGFLHGAKGRYYPNYTSAVAGAQQQQGYRAYAEFKRFIREVGDEVVNTLLSKTNWANGSLTEVLSGTVRGLNGPHPYFAQMDELELITNAQVFEEFLNMAQGDASFSAQQLLTSTRKKAYGFVQNIVKESEAQIKQGAVPSWDVRIFCVFETMAQVPNCRSAPENAGRPESELCDCETVVKGEWGVADAPRSGLAGKKRTFADVCNGRAYRADGFVQLRDVQSRFRQLSRFTWEAQQECLTPEIEGLVHKWIRAHHRLPDWMPFPQYGPVYRGWDWGGRNPHAVVWLQKLVVPVGMKWVTVQHPVTGQISERLIPITRDDDDAEVAYVVPEGAYVQFDETYGTADQLGEFSTLGIRAALQHERWKAFGFGFEIFGDYCDPAGNIAKREVRKAVRQLQNRIYDGTCNEEELELLHEYGFHSQDQEQPGNLPENMHVPEFRSVPAPRYESIRRHIEWGEDDKLYIVVHRCPATDDEYDAYHWEEKKPNKNEPEDAAKEDDHAMDAVRYVVWNRDILEDRGSEQKDIPAADRAPTKESKPKSPLAKPRLHPDQSPVGSVNREGEYWGDAPGASRVRSARGLSVRQVESPGIRR